MRLWETDLPDLLIFDDAFVWTLSNCARSRKAIWASWGSSRHIICGFWSASSTHANNAVHHIAVVGTLLTATASQHILAQDAKERQREWLIVSFGYKYNGKLETLLQTTCNKFANRLRLCANYWNILEAIKNRQKRTSSCCSFWWPLWTWNDAFVTAERHAWELFHSLNVQLVLVNSRPANCDSLMELSQSSTSAISSRFPEACLKRRNFCALKYFGVFHLVLSRRKLSCE